MLIFWPRPIVEPSESEVLDELHGEDWTHKVYVLQDDAMTIERVIHNYPGAFVYVTSPSHAVIAAQLNLRFGTLDYNKEALMAIHHFDPKDGAVSALKQVWAVPTDPEEEAMDFEYNGPRPEKPELN